MQLRLKPLNPDLLRKASTLRVQKCNLIEHRKALIRINERIADAVKRGHTNILIDKNTNDIAEITYAYLRSKGFVLTDTDTVYYIKVSWE